MLNLIERGLVKRDGNRYSISQSVFSYLNSLPATLGKDPLTSQRADIAMAVRKFNEAQKRKLRDCLMGLEPYEFEHFIRELLEAMKYENVEVTRQSGDKGIDVVAKHQFGITEITEVVQVKRTESTIGRPVIDALRGALPYHQAIRGTIITLGSFARNVEKYALFYGAAPITLIDGELLLELVIKHEVGLRKKSIDLYEVNEAFFAARASETEEALEDG